MNNGMYNNNMNNGMYNNNMNNGMYNNGMYNNNNMNNGMYNNGMYNQPNNGMYNNMNYNRKPYKKTSNTLIIVIILIFVVGLVGLGALFVFLAKNGDILIQGKWKCDNNIVLELKDKKFEMYNSSDRSLIDIKGSYKLQGYEFDNGTMKYTLVMSTNNRTIDGKKLTNNYETKYEIDLPSKDTNSMHMINTGTYSIYNCTKE